MSDDSTTAGDDEAAAGAGTPADDRAAATMAAARRLGDLTDLLTPFAIRAAVTLGVPALLTGGTDTSAAIAAAAGLDEHALDSLLRHLVGKDVLAEPEPGRFALTEMGQLLRSPFAAGQLDLGLSRAHMDSAWAALDETVRTGGPGYQLVHGRAFWDDISADARLAASFDQFMVTWADVWVAAVAAADVWPQTGTLVDVGGGAGRLLAAVLAMRPELRGVLFEGAGPVAAAAGHFAEQGITDRVTSVVGDFFDPWPPYADVYVLAQVLHDWPEADAMRILQRAAAALGSAGRLVVVDRVVDATHPSESHIHMNLLMHSLFGSRERTAEEFASLAASAGLRLVSVTPASHDLALVELVPAGGGA